MNELKQPIHPMGVLPTLIGLLVLSASIHGAVVTYPAPPEEARSPDYEVTVDGQPVAVYTARVLDPPFAAKEWDFGGPYSFAGFDMEGPVTVRLAAKRSLRETVLRPESPGTRLRVIDDHTVELRLDRPRKVSLEPDGKRGPLLLFANPLETNAPATTTLNVIYFAPGTHKPGLVTASDNQTVYLAGGAVVKGAIVARGTNIHIRGRGILDGSDYEWRKGPHPFTVGIYGTNIREACFAESDLKLPSSRWSKTSAIAQSFTGLLVESAFAAAPLVVLRNSRRVARLPLVGVLFVFGFIIRCSFKLASAPRAPGKSRAERGMRGLDCLLPGLTFINLLEVKIIDDQPLLIEALEISHAGGDLLFGELGFRGGPGGRGIGSSRGIRRASRTGQGRRIGRRGGRGTDGSGALWWWIVGGIPRQNLQAAGGSEVPPQERLHPVLGRQALMRDVLIPHFCAPNDGKVNGHPRGGRRAFDGEPRAVLSGC